MAPQDSDRYDTYFATAQEDLGGKKNLMVSIYSKYPNLGQPYRFVNKHLADDARILDAGAGQGTFLLITRTFKPNARLHACDIHNAVAHAALADVPFAKCDFETEPLPYADGSFDHVNCSHVLEHLHNPLDFLKELKRIVVPGGTVMIEVPDVRLTLVPHIPFLCGCEGTLNFWDDPTHIRPYSRPALVKLARMADFGEIVSCFYVHRWAHLLALPMALVSRNNDYKGAVMHGLGFFCGITLRKGLPRF